MYTKLGFSFLVILWIVSCFTFLSYGKHIEAPNDLMSRPELSLQQAETGNAQKVAPLEMRIARDKLAEAKQAMQKEDFDKAKYLATQSLTQAQLITAEGHADKAKKNVDETTNNLNA